MLVCGSCLLPLRWHDEYLHTARALCPAPSPYRCASSSLPVHVPPLPLSLSESSPRCSARRAMGSFAGHVQHVEHLQLVRSADGAGGERRRRRCAVSQLIHVVGHIARDAQLPHQSGLVWQLRWIPAGRQRELQPQRLVACRAARQIYTRANGNLGSTTRRDRPVARAAAGRPGRPQWRAAGAQHPVCCRRSLPEQCALELERAQLSALVRDVLRAGVRGARASRRVSASSSSSCWCSARTTRRPTGRAVATQRLRTARARCPLPARTREAWALRTQQ